MLPKTQKESEDFWAWARVISHSYYLGPLSFFAPGKGLMKEGMRCDYESLAFNSTTWLFFPNPQNGEEGRGLGEFCCFILPVKDSPLASFPNLCWGICFIGLTTPLCLTTSVNALAILCSRTQHSGLPDQVLSRFQGCAEWNRTTRAFPRARRTTGQALRTILPQGLPCTLVALSGRAVLL